MLGAKDPQVIREVASLALDLSAFRRGSGRVRSHERGGRVNRAWTAHTFNVSLSIACRTCAI